MRTIVSEQETQRKYQREWRQKRRKDIKFREKEIERNKQWRESNKEAVAEQKKQYYLKNKQKIQESKRKLYEERKKRAVNFDEELLSLAYNEAKRLAKLRTKITGITWSVDHIIPLKGENVSGLHVWNNLQVIPLTINKQKYNKHEEDCS